MILEQRQTLPLDAKVALTQRRIKEWYDHYKENNACCSFSGLVRYGSGDYERMGTTASLVQAMLFAMDVTAKCQKSEKGDRS